MKKKDNPIIEYHNGYAIRKFNQIKLRVKTYEFKKFIDAKEKFGLSEKDAIIQTGIICKPCNNKIQ